MVATAAGVGLGCGLYLWWTGNQNEDRSRNTASTSTSASDSASVSTSTASASPQSRDFDLASAYMRSKAASKLKLDQDTKLQLYALFKQSTQGSGRGARPGMLDMVGRAKWDAWSSLGETDRPAAMQCYTALVDSVADADWRETVAGQGESEKEWQTKKTEKVGPGGDTVEEDDEDFWDPVDDNHTGGGFSFTTGPSRMADVCSEEEEDEEEEDEEEENEEGGDESGSATVKKIFAWMNKGDVEAVRTALFDNQHSDRKISTGTESERTDQGSAPEIAPATASARMDINTVDPHSGLTLLHLATDGGHATLVEALLQAGAEVDVVDEDGLTPLHYGITCEEVGAVALLLKYGASALIKDEDGNDAYALVEDVDDVQAKAQIAALLEQAKSA